MITCGMVCGLLAWRMGTAWVTPAYVGAGAAGIGLAVMDAEFLLLPNKIIWPLYVWVTTWMAVDTLASGHASALVRAAGAGGILGLGGLALAFAFPAQFGLGDCKLLGILGALTGWLSWYAAWVSLLLGLLIGVVWGYGLVVARRKDRGTAFPLGPSLLLGAFVGLMLIG
jgi:leader peptidase (prepilin peptidase)/N-methyltransferase